MCFLQGMPPAALTDDEAFLEPSESQSDRKTSLSISGLDILSVNQLLESVRQKFHGALVFKWLFFSSVVLLDWELVCIWSTYVRYWVVTVLKTDVSY